MLENYLLRILKKLFFLKKIKKSMLFSESLLKILKYFLQLFLCFKYLIGQGKVKKKKNLFYKLNKSFYIYLTTFALKNL